MNQQSPDKFSIPNVSDDSSCSIGAIRINHDVIANIVRLSTLSVDGVVGVGSDSISSKIYGIFSRKRTYSGIKISEDENGSYIIDVQVILKFGVELAKIALDIQQNVTRQITSMTMKSVSQVNITIERVVQIEESDSKNTEYAIN